MRSAATRICFLLALAFVTSGAAEAQDNPRIGPFVFDARGTFPRFPSDNQELADSRGLELEELPGRGFGMDFGGHVYVFKWGAVTFGLGAQYTRARAKFTPPLPEDGEETELRAVTETFSSFAPQLSFNFGTGDGWSYISGGIGTSTWSLVPEGDVPGPADKERLFTINYGGGARWFARPHLAFTFDVRFWAINPGMPTVDFPGSPRTRLLSIGAGISVK